MSDSTPRHRTLCRTQTPRDRDAIGGGTSQLLGTFSTRYLILETYVNCDACARRWRPIWLTIKGERKTPSFDQGGWHRRERGYGRFNRTLELPTDVESDKVEAHFKHGVLLIELPKREEAKPRRIEVKAD